jgi:uncharacterized membrane protein YkgB
MSQSENLEFGQRLEKSGTLIIRFGLAIVLFWIGAMKFTQYEAEAIQPLVENSPFMGWLYSIFSVRTFSAVLGTVEIILAILIALRPVAAKVSAVGRRAWEGFLHSPWFPASFSSKTSCCSGRRYG